MLKDLKCSLSCTHLCGLGVVHVVTDQMERLGESRERCVAETGDSQVLKYAY